MANTQRYWDGGHWTEQFAPLAAPARATATSNKLPGQVLPTPVLMILVAAAVLFFFGIFAVIYSGA